MIGIPAEDGSGEIPIAYVVRAADSKLHESEVQNFLGDRLARYKTVHGVHFVEKIPRNQTGKILRRVLRDSREAKKPSPEQIAANEYALALKNLDSHQKRKRSTKILDVGRKPEALSSEDCPVIMEAIDESAKTEVSSRKVKRRMCCPSSSFASWWNLRSRSQKN